MICKKSWVRMYLLFYAETFCLSKPMVDAMSFFSGCIHVN